MYRVSEGARYQMSLTVKQITKVIRTTYELTFYEHISGYSFKQFVNKLPDNVKLIEWEFIEKDNNMLLTFEQEKVDPTESD